MNNKPFSTISYPQEAPSRNGYGRPPPYHLGACIFGFTLVNQRVAYLRLQVGGTGPDCLCLYTKSRSDYSPSLEQLLENALCRDCLVLLGDFQAHIGLGGMVNFHITVFFYNISVLQYFLPYMTVHIHIIL